MIVAKMKKYLLQINKSLEWVFGDINEPINRFYGTLSFKYVLNNKTNLTVNMKLFKGRRN